MRTFMTLVAALSLAALAAGCLTVSGYSFTFDTETGLTEIIYHDIRSEKEDKDDYSVAEDWAELKRIVESPDPDLDGDVVDEVSKKLFAEKKALSGRKKLKIKCPKCFPSKAAALAYLHDEHWRFEMINDEVVLFLAPDKTVTATNGRMLNSDMLNSEKNGIIVWPGETTVFEYTVTQKSTSGESLLPFFKKEKKKGADQSDNLVLPSP